MSDYRVSVNALVAFTARSGDLDLRFTPAPSAIEGIAGHQIIRQRRRASYESEIRLQGHYPGLTVVGRADGYDPETNTLEEIKTHRAGLERIPENQRAVHLAQAKLYGWLICQTRSLKQLAVSVVYYHVLSGEETPVIETFTAKQLQSFFNRHCEQFLSWAEQESAHRQRRDVSLAAMTFPHASYRTGQYELAAAVYRAARDEQVLLAQATTGIGKTLGTLFPQLKAMSEQGNDRLYFLTAKTPGRQLALDALSTLRHACFDLQLRVLEHVAREKACVYPDRACHGESCPLAQGFYDRLPAARSEAVQTRWLDHDAVRQIAQRHSVCPYYLSQEMAKWSDVFVGDCNYYFDMSALMYAYAVINEWRVTVLVDEAHNLVDRARGMYTASLDSDALIAARESAPRSLRNVFDRAWEAWHRATRDQDVPYRIYEQIPEDLLKALQRLVSQITDHLSEKPMGQGGELMRFYFEAMLFIRLAESHGDHSLYDVSVFDPTDPMTATTLTLRNILPAPFLENRFRATVSTTLFSATLTPMDYFKDMLGLPNTTRFIEVAAPFRSEQLDVLIDTRISTRYEDRPRSLEPVVSRMAEQFRRRPGNYLAFFSSYAYLQQVHDVFASMHADITTTVQQSGMTEGARAEFLTQFTDSSKQIGFCVLGGAFGEGIDLPGARLIGAFITTLGLPARTPVNEEIQRRMEARFGRGYAYAYFYPGIQKVIQAAGRVIRTETDSGVVLLLDDRYARSDAVSLLPSWWQLQVLPTHQPS